jgi:IS1 family transposase
LIKFDVVLDRKQETFDEFIDSIVDDKDLQVINYHTDAAKQYTEYFENNDDLNHTKTKDKTTNVESFNSILRGYVASLVRKTKVVNRSISNLYNNIYVFSTLYNKNIKSFLDFLKFNSTFAKEIDFNGVNRVLLSNTF